jgi:hypothetical protein
VQLRITPDGRVELLSTHDQLLGGPSGQSYLGCMFPADPGTALFMTSTGTEKHLVATDHLESQRLQALSVSDLFDVVARHGLHFHQARQTGIVFHMISSLTEHGRVGLTAVGNTRAEAQALYERAQRVLLDESDAALVESPMQV